MEVSEKVRKLRNDVKLKRFTFLAGMGHSLFFYTEGVRIRNPPTLLKSKDEVSRQKFDINLLDLYGLMDLGSASATGTVLRGFQLRRISLLWA
jgi:hypothetical protein